METPREPPVLLESKPLEVSKEFESRILIEDNIIAALKDENISTIGICGVGGIGKTRMARRIGEKVKKEKLFNIVVMVRVGPNSQLKRIAYEISDYLGVRLEEGNFVATSNELLCRLTTGERILIILDDVQETIDLEKIGILLQKHKGSFKIMITSRFKSACLEMGAREIFTVQGLTEEEIWIYLRESVDNSIDSSDLYPLAKSIAEECRGLPLVLNFVGKLLKYKSKIWPGVVGEKQLDPALSYMSGLLQETVAQGSSSHERKVMHVLAAEDVSLSFRNSLFKILQMNINLKQGHERSQTSLQSSIVSLPSKQALSLPPKRGKVKATIFSILKDKLALFWPRKPRELVLQDTKLHLGELITPAVWPRKPLEQDLQDTKLYLGELITPASLLEIEPGSNSTINHDIPPASKIFLWELDLQGSDIKVLPGEMKKLITLRMLNLTNCRNLEVIEPGIISSLVHLERLYMLGSFSNWEVIRDGKRLGNASMDELEFLSHLRDLEIEIHDPNIVPKNSRIWSRLKRYVVSITEDPMSFQEFLRLNLPSLYRGFDYSQFQRAIYFDLPSLTSLEDWMCTLLRNSEYLHLAGDGSKNAVDELIPDGFKLLKQLDISHCHTMKYLVDGVDQLLLTNGLFPSLESLCLEDLPLFMDISCCQLPVGLFGELRNLKLHRLPSLLHVCSPSIQSVSLSNLKSVHISHCPKLKSLFSLSMAQDLLQLEEIKIEYCEMMEEIFSEEQCEDCKTSNKIEFSKLSYLELDTLPNLTDFCKNVKIEFPQLMEMSVQSLRKFRTFCPTESDLPFEDNDDNGLQFLFNEKIAFGSLKKLAIAELDSATGIWCHQLSSSLFSELEVLVVISCDSLRNLFSYSVAKVLVQLKHLVIEDCSMMKEVIAEDGEIGLPEITESLFPQLKMLELRRLPILESFCIMINNLVLPSLEELTLYDCPEMKKFNGGQLHMPMLKCVKRDLAIYGIDGTTYTVQRLFNEKLLFFHHSWALSIPYQGTEVENVLEEEVKKESIHSHPKLRNEDTGGNRSANLQYDMNEKSFCSSSRLRTMTEKVGVDPPELKLEEEIRDQDAVDGRLFVGTKENEGHKQKSSHNAKLDVSIDAYVKDCVVFCSVFPSDYEFTKDMLVWQWIAERLIELEDDEIMEQAYMLCFDSLLNTDYIVPSGYDHFIDQVKYKVGDKMTEFLQKQQLEPKFQKYLESEQTDVAKVEHLSLAFKEIDRINFGILRQCSCLQTLIISRCYGSNVNYLPSDLFLELKALKILNLNNTNIKQLPTSVENLKELRFLDISETPIKWLPEAIRCLSNLQTLNLDGCLSLVSLPKCMSKLINLRHLIVDVVRQLQSMPIGIGNLSKLRTLRAFLVGEDDGNCIGELKNMNKLKGSLRILNLENVLSKEEAAEAYLCNKHDLTKIELQWSDLQDEKNPDEEEILESLQPPFGIQELKILFYSGGVLPSWISNPSFSELVSITLYRCRYCNLLPSLGELPFLKLLNIVENNEATEINSFFCRKQTYEHHVAFPKLEKLSFDSMSKLERWTGLEKGDFPRLRHLIMEYCPKLVGLPSLSHLNSLLHMEIRYCPELSCLPEDGMPPSLESLMIKYCPKLKEEDWSKVARVPAFYIDNQKVSL